MKKAGAIISGLLLATGIFAYFNYSNSQITQIEDLTFQRKGEIILLHEATEGRGLFSSPILNDNKLIVTYQIAPFDTLTENKNLYYRIYDRGLNEIQGQTLAIDVTDENSIWDGDLGDHKFTLINNMLYMVSLVKGEEKVRLTKFDLSFNMIGEEVRIGEGETEQFADMGIANDGKYIYTQFFYQGSGNTSPEDWGASIYKLTKDFEIVDSNVVQPDTGTFVTGTSLVYMGDYFQIFSTNLDYANKERVGIHTFAVDSKNLELISGSTQTIIERNLDVYFPVGTVWNEKHKIWIVGYTQEIAEGVHSGDTDELEEIGPSFITIFDPDWNELKTIQLNDGDYAFRVMLASEGDDIYVTYDEIDYGATTENSVAKLEHYKIEN